ncbi:MAG: VOC family protein [Deltaproteobacteria bacterium]|nr:VOC family protein [Deltaproteobacteria bacterium]
MKISIAHVCVYTRDLDATRRFYCDVLGMKKVFDFTLDGKPYGFYLEMCEGNFIEVFHNDDYTEETNGALRHLCLETDDIAGVRAKLTDAGIDTTDIVLGCDNTHQFWFKDPNGIDIEFHQYTKDSAQHTGANCEVDWV